MGKCQLVIYTGAPLIGQNILLVTIASLKQAMSTLINFVTVTIHTSYAEGNTYLYMIKILNISSN